MKYVVEVLVPLPSDPGAVAGHIARAFRIPPARAKALLKRAPGVVTRPIPQPEADRVAGMLVKAGLNAAARPAEAAPGASVDTAPVARPVAPPPPRPTATAAAAPSSGGTSPQTPTRASGQVSGQPSGQESVPPSPSIWSTGIWPAAGAAAAAAPAAGGAAVAYDAPPRANRGVDPDAGPDAGPDTIPEVVFDGTPAGGTRPAVPVVAVPAATPPEAAGDRAARRREAGGDVALAARARARARRAEADAAAEATPARRRGVSLRAKILWAGIVPALLAVAFALAAVGLTLGPALRGMQLEAARSTAVALAASLEALLGDRPLADAALQTELQTALTRARTELEGRDVAFVLVTDAAGERLAGWPAAQELAPALTPAVEALVRDAAARDYARRESIELGAFEPPSRRVEFAGGAVEVASRAIAPGDAAIGAVVVGVANAALIERLRTVLAAILGAGLVPLLLAVAVAALLARAFTRDIYYLIGAADEISRGDLSRSVEVRANDELGDLAQAIERMRVSLQEGLERLRRRRR